MGCGRDPRSRLPQQATRCRYDGYRGCYVRGEHIVALQEAHFSGMCVADTETKRTFAGDILKLALAAAEVDSAKGPLDAFDWMPETNRCWSRSGCWMSGSNTG